MQDLCNPPARTPAPPPQQRVLLELERLERAIRPGCMSIAAGVTTLDTDGPKNSLRQRIERAQIALLLASGPEEVNRIYNYTPHNLGWLLLGPKPRTIEEAVRLVAHNLDWYLDPPKPLFRWEWVGSLISTIFLAYSSLAFLLLFLGAGDLARDMVALSLLLIVCVWIGNYGDAKRHHWVWALRRYMQETYASPPE
jgi:hypothetical protein